ncbi:structural cement protein Gp24 [Anaerosolibacter sp.]|uniref:structural cement protein Gp24 n=1 Tax=Anaerosolibacter sp. TaxID=1872527 RepID=UPI0039F02447
MLTPTGSGRIAEGNCGTSAGSMAAENTIAFGQAVKYGTDKEKQVKAWDGAASADKFAGIALHGVTGDLDNDQYVQGNAVPVLKKGTVWVKVSANSAAGVIAGQTAAVRDDGFFDAGPLVVGTSGKYGVEIDGSEFLTGGEPGDLVKLSINLPSKTSNVQL